MEFCYWTFEMERLERALEEYRQELVAIGLTEFQAQLICDRIIHFLHSGAALNNKMRIEKTSYPSGDKI